MTATERFLKYITFDTQSDEGSETVPTTAKQKVLGAYLAQELADMGLENPHMDDLGRHLIVTDGTTLLGADDKAGVAEIFSAPTCPPTASISTGSMSTFPRSLWRK